MTEVPMKTSIILTIIFSITIFLGSYCVAIGENFTAIDPMATVKDMSPGWSLGNTLDTVPTEGSLNNPPAEEYIFDDIKKAGFKTVRIPVTWAYHMGPAPDYKVDPKWMDRVEQVVDWALKRDLYVVLNVQGDNEIWIAKMAIDPQTGNYVNDYSFIFKLEKLWQQIAERFNGKSEKLILEIPSEPPPKGGWREDKFGKPEYSNHNEIRRDLTPEQMDDMNRRILKIIRSSGGYNDKRLIMVCGLGSDIETVLRLFKLKFFKVPDDEHIILAFHYSHLKPWDFYWGTNTWGTAEDKAYSDKIFQQLYSAFVKNNLPVVINEYRVLCNQIDRFSRYYFYDYIVKTAYKNEIATIWWDWGVHYHRTKRYWIDKVSKDIIINAARGISNSFVFPLDNYFKQQWDTQRGVPVNANVEDLTAKLELNGNQLVDIYNGKDKLIKDRDYTVDTPNSTVTIKKDYLSGLLKPGKLGVNAVLKFNFSNGADLPMDIIQYDFPQFPKATLTFDKSKSKTQPNIIIPVSFNGAKLDRISLVDKTNKKPVKNFDTPYIRLQMDYDYTDTGIILKKDLIDSLKTDSLITFEFCPKDVKVEMEILVVSPYLMFNPIRD